MSQVTIAELKDMKASMRFSAKDDMRGVTTDIFVPIHNTNDMLRKIGFFLHSNYPALFGSLEIKRIQGMQLFFSGLVLYANEEPFLIECSLSNEGFRGSLTFTSNE